MQKHRSPLQGPTVAGRGLVARLGSGRAPGARLSPQPHDVPARDDWEEALGRKGAARVCAHGQSSD